MISNIFKKSCIGKIDDLMIERFKYKNWSIREGYNYSTPCM